MRILTVAGARHREENTQDDKDLTEIFRAMEQMETLVGYLDSICLVNNAEKIVGMLKKNLFGNIETKR